MTLMPALIGWFLILAILYLFWSGALSSKNGRLPGEESEASKVLPLEEEHRAPSQPGSTGVEAIQRTRALVEQIQGRGEGTESLP
ncbi:MAG: hypothetical protein SNJ52_04335 [Verrucomicrobiia bacterium]